MVMYGISLMFSFILQTARGMLNTVICTAYFSENFDSAFSKKYRNVFVFVQCSYKKEEEEEIGDLEYSL